MDLPVAGGMQHLQIVELVATAFGAPGFVVRVPAALKGDDLLADGTPAVLHLPERKQFGPQTFTHFALYAFFKVQFPVRVEWVGMRLDFSMSANERVCRDRSKAGKDAVKMFVGQFGNRPTNRTKQGR